MKTIGEPILEDDASGEAWFQRGVTLLEGRKQEREIEERLKKRMAHPVVFEPAFWIGIVTAVAAAWTSNITHERSLLVFYSIMIITQLCSALDTASQKRLKAMLDWIEHQKAKEKQMD